MMKTWALVAVAAMGLTACQNDYEEQIEAKDKVVVSFLADAAEGRTSVNTEGDAPVFAWDDAESFAVLEQTDKLAVATDVNFSKKENGSAEITAAFDYYEYADGYKYVAVYPEAGYVSGDFAEATLTLPAEQTMVAGSYDPAADLMVSKVVATDVQPTEIQPLRFTRLAAVAKMSFRGIADGEKVESVTFTAEGKTIAGNLTASLETPYEFTVAEGGSNSVTVKAAGEDAVYFTLLPTTLEAGESYTVTVITDKKIYVKEGIIAEGKTLQFAAGMVTRFGVDLTGVAPSDKWVLVRDVNDLESGDIVTFVSKDYNAVLGAKFSGTSYPYASQTEVVKIGDYLYHPITSEGTTSADKVIQQLVVAKQDGMFGFYNGVDYSGDAKVGFASVKSSSYFTLQDAIDGNSLFDVTIDQDAVATVKATNSTVTAKYVYYYHNTSLTSRYFRAQSAAPTGNKNMCIYKIEGAKGVVDASITLPESGLVVASKEANYNTIADEVIFNYTDNWEISVSEEADWLEVGYADGKLTYTTQANENTGTRKAVVTIEATCNGEEKSWEFSLLQKGEPQPISVTDFVALTYNSSNVESLYYDYRITGVLKSKTSTASGSTTVTDPNNTSQVATFKYLYLPDGKPFYNNSGDVAAGDIVSIVASLTNKGTGGSDDVPATYEGYYNISAKATKDLVVYGGGSVEISIEKEGTLQPGTINGSVDGTFAELATNGDKYVLTLKANEGAPRQAVATFTDGYATTSVTIVQGADDSKGLTWERVTDASTLRAGDRVIIAAKDYDVAMSTQLYNNASETSTSAKRDAVSAEKLGDYYIIPNVTMQQFVLMNGSEANTFAFYDEARKAFLVSTNTNSKYLINQPYINENASFAISIADGVATVGNVEGKYNENKLWYYEDDNYFHSGTSEYETICLYRLAGVIDPIVPVAPASVTVPEKAVVVAEEGAAEATAIEEVVFNYVGDWAISVSTEAEWLNVNYADGKLTYTADANTSIVREATVTITATHEGEENLTWSFGVLQKGSAQEISIVDFKTKSVDVNVSYKITGRVTVASITEGGYYTLADENGNTAEVRYVYTEGGDILAKQDIVKVGDVMTVTTVVTTSSGKGGSSSYHSIYKGHYRLTATVEPAIVSYEGGDATISVALTKNGTLGTLCPPTAIEGTMAESDFATMTYTPDATSATVSFAANAGASRKVEATFKSGLAEASVAIGQQNDPSVKVGWFLVTDVNELAVGDKVIIAAKNPDETLDYAIKKYTSNTGSSSGIAIELLGNSISNVEGVEQFTLGSGHADYEGTWSFVCDTYSRYLYVNSSNIKIKSTLDSAGAWTIAIADDGKATLTSKVGSTKNTMMFNYTTSNQTFSANTATTTTGKGAIYIYKYYNSLEQ